MPTEDEELEEPVKARDCLVQRGVELRLEYKLGVLELGAGESELTLSDSYH